MASQPWQEYLSGACVAVQHRVSYSKGSTEQSVKQPIRNQQSSLSQAAILCQSLIVKSEQNFGSYKLNSFYTNLNFSFGKIT